MHYSLMFISRRQAHKSLSTIPCAGVRSLSLGMLSLYVHAQYARRAELLVAEDADEWFVAGMRAYVCSDLAGVFQH